MFSLGKLPEANARITQNQPTFENDMLWDTTPTHDGTNVTWDVARNAGKSPANAEAATCAPPLSTVDALNREMLTLPQNYAYNLS